MSVSRISFLAVLALFSGFTVFHSASAADGWPDGYELNEETNSPDGRYGILITSRDGADDDEEKVLNKLVEIKSHRILGTIKGSHYFSGQNHHGLDVNWGNDNSWCAVNYLGRWGFENVTLIDLKNGAFKQVEIGAYLQRALGNDISRQSKGKLKEACGTPNFTDGPGQQIKVRATGFTNPKQFPDQLTLGTLFSGVYDLAAQKWVSSSARTVDPNKIEDLDYAFDCTTMDDSTFDTQENRFKYYDDHLNQVYRALHYLLPAERFAAVKKEQVVWLKTLEAAGSNDAKCKLMAERIAKLRELAW